MAISRRRLRQKAQRIIENVGTGSSPAYSSQRQLIQQDINNRNAQLGQETSSLQSMGGALQRGLAVGRGQIQRSQDLLGRDRRIAMQEYGARGRDIAGGTQLAIAEAQHSAQQDNLSSQQDLQKLAINEQSDIQAKFHALLQHALPNSTDMQQRKEFRDSLAQAGELYRDALAHHDTPHTAQDWEDFTGVVAKRSLGTGNDAIIAVRALQHMLRFWTSTGQPLVLNPGNGVPIRRQHILTGQ